MNPLLLLRPTAGVVAVATLAALSVTSANTAGNAAPQGSVGTLTDATAASAQTHTSSHARAQRKAWRRVSLPNGSFTKGQSRWKITGAHGRTSRPGHRDGRALVLATPKTRTVHVRPAAPVVPSGADGVTYRAKVWVRSDAVGSSVQLRLGTSGTSLDAAVSRSRVTHKKPGWRRLTVSYRAPAGGAPIDLKVTATGLRPGHRVVIDDLAVDVRAAAASAGRSWASGASGSGVADQQFAAWRGSPVDIAGTWNDSAEAQTEQWSVRPGAEYGAWQGDLDIAVGGIYKDQGESWAAAAAGAYDARWSKALSTIAASRAGLPGTVYLRFAHEFNGDWYPWSVTGKEAASFQAAWIRFAHLRDQLMPQAKLVFCPNTQTSPGLGLDWRAAYPGNDYVDVLAVDMYNQYPFTKTKGEFARNVKSTDDAGAPKGLEEHRRFAAEKGKPFALAEWSSNADMGDSAVFMRQLHAWMVEHGGSGPGQLLYEIEFNVGDFGSGQFQLYPATNQPAASAAYQQLW